MTNAALPRTTPESQGVDSEAIEAFVLHAVEHDLQLHSLMVLRHGNVVAEGWWAPYSAPQRHMMFSVSKSFTAAAIGIAEAEGRLSVDDEVLSFFPSYATDAVRANVAGLQVKHLLAMATGHAVDTMGLMTALPDSDWVKVFLEVPLVYPPGTHFLYNSGASFMLAAIITARTGQSVLEYLEPRLFQPLGIETPPWQNTPRGINLGSSGLRVRTEDLAKLGQLYLQRGTWDGQQLLTEEWVDRASSVHADNSVAETNPDSTLGYGYQFWRSRHNSYRADGAFGQFSLILPDLDLVVAITEGTTNAQTTLNAVWDLILPGVHAETLPENTAANARLSDALATLEVPVPVFLAADPERASVVADREIELPFNTLGLTSASVRFDDAAVHLTVTSSEGWSETLPAGRTQWLAGETRAWNKVELERAVTASKAGWIDASTLVIRQQCVDTPFARVWTFAFAEGDAVSVSIAFEPAYWMAYNEDLTARIR
jgi:CubicO group peptidase (beta-lactamase class C family)